MSNKKINIGINILRMWMAFEVILLHRCSWKGYDGFFFQFLKRCELFSVPVFMILAFYFSGKAIVDKHENIKDRLIRIIIPQIGWAIICWTIHLFEDIVLAHKLQHNFMDLIIAILTGSRANVNPSTWFQMVLLLLTLIYFVIFKLFKKETAWIITYLTFIFALLVQMNGQYYYFFTNTTNELENTIGRIFEIMPFAATGLFFYHIDIINLLKKKRYLYFGIFLCLFIIGFYIPFPTFEGFFAGLYTIYMGICLFIIFALLPLEDVSDNTRNIILNITKYTLGIYCAHRLVYGILDVIYEILHISIGSFEKCVILYIACYIMSFIMSKLYMKKLVE